MDLEEKLDNQCVKSSHFKLKELHFLFTQYSLHLWSDFPEITQFVFIINSLNPIDFEKKKKKKIEQSVREK